MRKLDKDIILKKLDALKDLPNIKEVRALRKRLNSELERISKTEKKQTPPREEGFSVFFTPARVKGYEKVHGKLRSYHSLVRQLKKNYFPDLSYREVQQRVKSRRERNDVDPFSGIQDAYWQNISP